MPHVDAALVREQGVKFAVVVVSSGTTSNRASARAAIVAYRRIFGLPLVVLMEQDARGVPTYYGRPDIVRFLSGIDFRQLPWSRYSVN